MYAHYIHVHTYVLHICCTHAHTNIEPLWAHVLNNSVKGPHWIISEASRETSCSVGRQSRLDGWM